jgi:glycosyltransferase involved in cell wall biosynthesis
MASTDGAMRRLRVLHVVSAYYPAVRYGGPIRSVHALCAGLARRGHDVHVYTTSVDGDADMDVPLGTPVILDGVKVHYFRVPALRRLCWAPALGRRLHRYIAEFDVVHIHGVYLWPMWAAARAAERAGVPYILAPRGMLVRDLIRRKSRWVKTAWIELVERRTIARAAGIHVTSELEGAELETLHLPAHRITCIPNGVEIPPDHLPRSATPFAGLPDRYVLFLSRITWKKGLDRLITAWQWVTDVPLVIVGNDDEGYQSEMQTLVHSLSLDQRVIFAGPAADADKWALYEQAQLFVLPSYSENFANVVAEAMGMGCPVVVTAEVGIAPWVEAVGAGVVVNGNASDIAKAVNELLASPARRHEMGLRGASAVRAQLSWSSVAEQAETQYATVMKSRNSQSVYAESA